MTGTVKSSRGNICAQLFVSDKGFVAIYPMKKQSDYFLALKQFAKDVDAPDVLVCDPHPAQTKREVREFCTCYSSEHRGGTCLCMVGALRSTKEGCYYFGCELSSSQDKP